MTCTKLFTILLIVVSSVSTASAGAANYDFSFERPLAEDTLKPQQDTTLLVEYIPVEPNDVIADRLSCIESEIPLTFNPFVRSFIDYFTIRNRKYTRKMISRQTLYFPLFEEYLKKHNMPQELKYLSIVESGLYPKAASHAGAVGLWQFIKVTGKEYGLEQNEYIDERMDPEKATEAACRFLKRLYNRYDDWELAMAAYNCGPGNVNKAIRRAGGGKKTFWEIFKYLPTETRSYVPSMTAVIYAMNYAPEHNLFSDSILYAPAVDYLQLDQPIDLEKLAAELHTDTETLMGLNTELKQTVLPESLKNYRLRVPAQSTALLATDRACILLAAAPTPKVPVPAPDAPDNTPALLASAKQDSIVPTTYIVQRGDNLIQIAQKHQVTVAQLKEWNQLESTRLQINQQLTVLQPVATEEPALLASAAPVEATAAKPVSARTTTTAKLQKVRQVHHVQEGDTLWSISQRYDGITVEQIKKRNNLKSSAIKPGQKLIII
ncbi:lytic transglycosylase domain-containing protein [Botryobacter ruber]|uniref:lytic transglycosylase domain-containing protein n=1 Tax=Botryobacter ruber TaxID=2171629 RepID=UPI000E0A763D|nr:lytic transglycosylase domain-containing protein [Botryobacter ruber]